jgi:hypothetical protein
MNDQALLRRVPRSGLRIGGELVPLVFFRHGQPGRPFVVCPEEEGWRIHVRTTDTEAIRNAYRQYAAAHPPRQHRRHQSRTGKRTTAARPPAGIPAPPKPASANPVVLTAPSKDSTTLLDAERRELERANVLAVQLIEMKSHLMNTGRIAFADKGLLHVQELHARHLNRCLHLRSLLSDFVHRPSEDPQPA